MLSVTRYGYNRFDFNNRNPKIQVHLQRFYILSRDKTGLIRENMILEKTVDSISRISPPGCSSTH